jgi:GGDEF domain-containing protein
MVNSLQAWVWHDCPSARTLPGLWFTLRRHNRCVSHPTDRERIRQAEAALHAGAADAAARAAAHRTLWQAHKALGEFEAALTHCEAWLALTGAPPDAEVDATAGEASGIPPALTELHAQSRQRRKPLALAALEVIDAAALRARHGAGVADAVEREVAQLLRLRLRSRDLALPWTQRRWLVALADTPPAAAAAICERLRVAVQQHDWAFVAPGLQVAIALGLVTDAADLEPHAALLRVDAALRGAALRR